jgi:hypothetical protein
MIIEEKEFFNLSLELDFYLAVWVWERIPVKITT